MSSEEYKLLDTISSPRELKKLSAEELRVYCDELRRYIIDECSVNPGHLASSLGAVELSAALHYVFETPEDRIVWDVGHQTYAHKIITGRREAFRTKRRNLYKSREQVLEILVEKLRVKTLRGKSVYSNTSPAYRYIREMYGKMVSEGRLVEGCKQTASGKLPLCRTATGRELKMKRREDDRTE